MYFACKVMLNQVKFKTVDVIFTLIVYW